MNPIVPGYPIVLSEQVLLDLDRHEAGIAAPTSLAD
jgi:hypothetical protein